MNTIVEVIGSLPSSKSLGPDGFAAEFFKCYTAEVAPLLLNMYNEAMEKGELPPTLSQALITLKLKKDKDPTECKSYRPISLIPVDVKILSKILANRLDSVITSLVHGDQVGFIHGRSGADNIRRFINIIWAMADVNLPVAAISLDAEKAFDHVEWGYLFETLKTFGFGSSFLKWIKLLYT